MGLDEHAVDLFQIDRADLVADGLDQRGYAEVFYPAQQPFARAQDEGECVGSERIVAEGGAIQFTPAIICLRIGGRHHVAGCRPVARSEKRNR